MILQEGLPRLSPTYPMLSGNPCLDMSDEQFKAYIREKRKEFEEKYQGKSSKQIAAEMGVQARD